jgi:hypothetical protein
VRDCRFGAYCEVGARTTMAEVEFGDYSYVVHDSQIIYATIGSSAPSPATRGSTPATTRWSAWR